MQIGVAPKTNLKQAVIFIVIAAFLNASLAALTKFSFVLLTTMQMVFSRNLISLILFFSWLYISKNEKPMLSFLRPRSFKMQLIRTISGFSSICLFVYSLKLIDLSEASVLYNTMPIFVPIIAYLWKGNKIHHKTWWGILTAFLGILFVVQPNSTFSIEGALLALSSGILGAVATLSLRYSHYTEPSSRTLFYHFLLSTCLAATFLPFEYQSMANIFTLEGGLLILAIGILGLIFQVFFTLATKYAPARLISPFYYSAVVFSVFYDWFFWGEEINLYKIIGFVFIFIGVCLVVLLYPKDVGASKPGSQ